MPWSAVITPVLKATLGNFGKWEVLMIKRPKVKFLKCFDVSEVWKL